MVCGGRGHLSICQVPHWEWRWRCQLWRGRGKWPLLFSCHFCPSSCNHLIPNTNFFASRTLMDCRKCDFWGIRLKENETTTQGSSLSSLPTAWPWTYQRLLSKSLNSFLNINAPMRYSARHLEGSQLTKNNNNNSNSDYLSVLNELFKLAVSKVEVSFFKWGSALIEGSRTYSKCYRWVCYSYVIWVHVYSRWRPRLLF